MIFNNERYETVAFWDKYKHVVNVYDTAEKKVNFHIANRKEERVFHVWPPAGTTEAADILGLLMWLHRLSG